MRDFVKEDILEVISRYTDLTPHNGGKYYTGFCPLHDNSNTPALVVYPNDSPEDSQWLCFGCHPDSSDVIEFVMLAEECSFKQAVAICARVLTPIDALIKELGRTDSGVYCDLPTFSLRAYEVVKRYNLGDAQRILKQLDEFLAQGNVLQADKWLAQHKV